jgi:hypothetical protein
MLNIHEFQLRQMLSTAAEMGAKNALREMGVDKTQISKAEAYRRFSRRRIDRWVREGKIMPIKSKGSVLFNASELESQAQTVELYMNHLEPIKNKD